MREVLCVMERWAAIIVRRVQTDVGLGVRNVSVLKQ
jgi:hypothetical protein